MDVAGIRDIDEVRHQRGHRFVANRFHRPAVVLVDGAERARLVTPTINYPLHVAALINHVQDPAFINVKWIG